MSSCASLEAAHRELASHWNFDPGIDHAVYARFGQDPLHPVISAGSHRAVLCILGRDLGKDEVRYQEPLIGAAGRAIRKTLHRYHLGEVRPADPPHYRQAMQHVCITNTVPYKPMGNAPFSEATREAFRPLVERFITEQWHGTILMPLGTGALEWCRPYGADVVDQLRALPLPEWVSASGDIELAGKRLTLWPLPHPSPLSQYARQFPDWLIQRLRSVSQI